MNNPLRYIFLVLVIVGVIVPYMAFVPFVAEQGLNIPILIEQAGANRIAAFAWLDVVVSAAVLLVATYSPKVRVAKTGWSSYSVDACSWCFGWTTDVLLFLTRAKRKINYLHLKLLY